jgi:four helix bundle protein
MSNYDLEERTFEFAKMTRSFIKELPKRLNNTDDCKQLIRSSGSVGANYMEANESLGKKDFLMRLRIAKKESKESLYWLRLLDIGDNRQLDERKKILIKEAFWVPF